MPTSKTVDHQVRRPARRCLLSSLAGISLALIAAPAAAEPTWPTRPIRLIVPFAAGGGTDIVARALAQRLSQQLGQPVVVENKPGAATVIGTDQVAKAAPDGYTLLLSGSTSFTVNPALRPKLPYNPATDLLPIGIVTKAPLVYLVNADSPWRTLTEFAAAARARPGSINYATFGAGSGAHLAGALLERAAGIKLQDVAYKGSAPALVGLIGGEIQLVIDTVASGAPHVRSGKLRALAVLGAERSSMLPAVPTVAEQKLPDATLDAWYALAAPARLAPAIQQILERETAAALADRPLQAVLRNQALEPVFIGTRPAQALMQEETARFRALAHRANIVVD